MAPQIISPKHVFQLCAGLGVLEAHDVHDLLVLRRIPHPPVRHHRHLDPNASSSEKGTFRFSRLSFQVLRLDR